MSSWPLTRSPKRYAGASCGAHGCITGTPAKERSVRAIICARVHGRDGRRSRAVASSDVARPIRADATTDGRARARPNFQVCRCMPRCMHAPEAPHNTHVFIRRLMQSHTHRNTEHCLRIVYIVTDKVDGTSQTLRVTRQTPHGDGVTPRERVRLRPDVCRRLRLRGRAFGR